MPALRGSLTYARFFVEGEVPDDFRERFMRSIRHRAMKPLEPDEEDLERSGWCRVGEAFELDLGYEDVFYNEYLNLGFRTDRWVVPGPMLRAKMREAEAAYLAKKGREKMSRNEKKELKELVSRRLRRQLSPATRMADLSWSLGDGIVRFFNHSPKSAGLMTELFTRTFNLKLIPEAPYTLAARLGLTKAQEKVWQELEAVDLMQEA
jgi:recombination associated protein RdgC